ncbi:MAG: Xaa-Pro peptidase family protein [Nitrososphaerota archaeon]|nr:Xaa-Pro peptidase family protein [Nitrososphaerota archaeon]
MRYAERINQMTVMMERYDLEVIIIMDSINLRYFTGVPGPGLLVITKTTPMRMHVPPINYESAEKYCVPDIEIDRTKQNENLEVVLAHTVADYERVGIDRVNGESYQKLLDLMPRTKVTLLHDSILNLRAVKDPEELGLINEACKISERVMRSASELLVEGVHESEIKSEIVREIYRRGGERPAFEPIVASGEDSSLPHGPQQTSQRRDRALKRGDVVVIDLGVVVEGYCSDMTRTFVVDRPADPGVLEAIDAVVKAKQDAESFLKPGISCSYVDLVARKTLAEKGFEACLIHGLGHGIGLEVHEPPRLVSGNPENLQEGMVVTVEPGVYIKGTWGIRIEDTVLVTERGPQRLTDYPLFLEV